MSFLALIHLKLTMNPGTSSLDRILVSVLLSLDQWFRIPWLHHTVSAAGFLPYQNLLCCCLSIPTGKDRSRTSVFSLRTFIPVRSCCPVLHGCPCTNVTYATILAILADSIPAHAHSILVLRYSSDIHPEKPNMTQRLTNDNSSNLI